MRVGGVLLAAGEGSRFRAAGGGAKQLASWNGRPLVEAALSALARSPLDDRVVVLGAEGDAVLAAIDAHGARPVRNERWAEGIATSLRAGLAALDDCDAAVIVLGDGPLLSPLAVARVVDALQRGAQYARAVYSGDRFGHPVGLARAAWGRVPESGEAGGKALGTPDALVACGDLPAPGDVDTPEALANCRSGAPRASSG